MKIEHTASPGVEIRALSAGTCFMFSGGTRIYIKTTIPPSATGGGFAWYVCLLDGEAFRSSFNASVRVLSSAKVVV